MILSFKTQIEKKPTYFIEKIWKGLLNKNFNLLSYNNFRTEASLNSVIDQWDYSASVSPKIHTLREDVLNRWKIGMKIDFFINPRQRKMFRFAPVLPVLGIQDIQIKWKINEIRTVEIFIDNECYVQNYSIEKDNFSLRQERMEQLAKNDGFDSVEDFLDWFSSDWKGKIIHWTTHKY